MTQYDSQGRVTAVLLPAVPNPSNGGALTRPEYVYGYDERGNQFSIVDPNRNETFFTYDDLGRQVTRTLPLGAGDDQQYGTSDDDFTESFHYDDRGRRYLTISFEGVHMLSIYDADTGRMTATEYFVDAAAYSNSTVSEYRTYSYDDEGRVTAVESFLGDGTPLRSEVTTFTTEGQVETITNDEGTIFYEYDDVFNRLERTSFMGREFTESGYDNVTEYSYDELGRLQTVSAVQRNNTLVDVSSDAGIQPDTTTYVYDLIGNLDQTIYSNGLIHDYDYDSLNRLEELYHWVDVNSDGVRDEGSVEDQQDFGEVIALFDYQLRADGKRTGVTETFVDTNITNTIGWLYDDAGRLYQESFAQTGSGADLNLNYSDTFVWDLTGNRTTYSRVWGGGSANNDFTTTYGYDANDRLETELKDYVSIHKYWSCGQ